MRPCIISEQSDIGLVISRYGNRAEIESSSGQRYNCHIRRALQDLVTGDRVEWAHDEGSQDAHRGIVTKILPRTSVLERPIRYQGVKPVASNIDQIFVVTAIEPPFSRRILDRYLVAIEQTGVEACLVLNKTDLIKQGHAVYEDMASYQQLGYRVLNVSSHNGEGLDSLVECLQDRISVFVGQSGVGKSSLVNKILPEVDTAVSSLSDNSGLGTHTTTTSRLYHLPSGGQVIDSPGIREFGVDHLEPQNIATGFCEFERYLGLCKFRDCHHIKEPGCAVQNAVKQGEVDTLRYESYKLLYQEALEE